VNQSQGAHIVIEQRRTNLLTQESLPDRSPEGALPSHASLPFGTSQWTPSRPKFFARAPLDWEHPPREIAGLRRRRCLFQMGESAEHRPIKDVEAYEASISEGRHSADKALYNQTAPASE
jgi:hypothetical protein